jgi:hypothetical protein
VDGIEHGTCFTAAGMYTPPELAERIAAAQIPVCPTLDRHLDAPIPPRIQEMLECIGLTWELRTGQVGELRRAGVRLIGGGATRGSTGQIAPDPAGAGGRPGCGRDVACRGAGLDDRRRRRRLPARRADRAAPPCLAADLLIVDGNRRSTSSAARRAHRRGPRP